ncbi:3-deoxy-manno-octulosonate cytidylyltransferase [Polynucleobacter bastaniensis]|uniref:3-deoxy-manno-octulosonate cytidylyltransferase n=1 Tax=Polynucleobacter bastaniensis TaxID=2081039 RepID=UPI001C0DC324|nr:3-deoxy-manno-octulosonate cytidylyltransferase [Polynucleobacter bastaniensis]MBU3598271.1 3-deoxy-manno-octulosonate cytidylyltransferase [Polynucleobacter bastaniensis]
MKAICIIPSRMASSRFPNKPLKNICGIPMIGHCYLRAVRAKSFVGVYVATCDQSIASCVADFGGLILMTSDGHTRATTRTAEAMMEAEKKVGHVDIVVMVQGDEPLVNPSLLDELSKIFVDESVNIVNVMTRFGGVDDFTDRNNIKVVVDKDSDALYFSRQPIPFDPTQFDMNKAFMQTGIIAFRRDALIDFNEIPESFLEVSESIDMNRVLENKGTVRMHLTADKLIGVDVAPDIAKVEELMKIDDLYLDYSLNLLRDTDVL